MSQPWHGARLKASLYGNIKHMFYVTMEGYANLPAIVLELVFSYLTVAELLQVAQVCTTWQSLINHIHFWFRRMYQMDIQMNPELKSKLTGSQLDQGDTLSLLKRTCLFKEDASSLQLYLGGSAETMDDGLWWEIKEEDILVASVLLLTRTPRKVSIRLRSDPDSIRYMGLFFLVLSYNSCDISIQDLYSWRNSCNSSNQLLEQLNACKRGEVRKVWTAVNKIDALPATVMRLRLSLLVNPRTGAARDPGLTHLTQRCPRLEQLGIHVKAGTATDHLPCLPYVEKSYLYLSHLSDDHHLQWAVDTARTLQPPTRFGYWGLFLPSCCLCVEQLCELVGWLADVGVGVYSGVYISSQHTMQDEWQLDDAIEAALCCGLNWVEDDDHLSGW